MKNNVIILTSGLSGSSVLANLISRAGYWISDETYKKFDYDTHENIELVRLNRLLLDNSNYNGDYTNNIDHDAITKIDSLDNHLNIDEYFSFLKHCGDKSPWIWKDPRLWVTILFWNKILDNNIKYILLDRSLLQRWISVNLRRKIETFRYVKNSNDYINNRITNFFYENKKEFIRINFDDLLLYPERTIETLNNFLQANLTLDDLKAVYDYPLYRKKRGFIDFIRALAIFTKNFTERK